MSSLPLVVITPATGGLLAAIMVIEVLAVLLLLVPSVTVTAISRAVKLDDVLLKLIARIAAW